ncbi:MAG TPA: TonB-dependent receptor [Gemmatimonadales bacterium]|jgi:iron complex outermembrane receptor protein|nr:TonB-dependent receptor [Gemmatimonadales bacterium]
MTRVLRSVLMLGIGAHPLAAQATGVVFGTVTDTAGHPVPYAEVQRAGTSLGTTASQSGAFRMAGIAAGAVAITVRAPGYHAATDTVRLAAGDSVRIDFRLPPSGALDLQPVIVTAAKRSQLLDEAVTSVAVVTGTELQNRAVSTVDEAVNKAAGVLFLNGQVNIRGSSGFVEGLGSRVLLLVDGVPANEGDRGGIDWDMVPLDDVDRVEVVKGAGSSLYGSAAFGGVVNLITHDIPVGFHGRVRATAGDYANPPQAAWTFRDYTGGLGGLDATGSYGSPILRGSLTLGGRHSDGYREQDRSNQWETAGKAEWDPAPDTRLTASGSWTSHQYEVGPPWCEHGQCDDRGLAFQPFRTASPGAYTRSDKGYVAATLERTASPHVAWQARGSWLRSHFTDVKPDNWGIGNRFGAELRGTVRAGAAAARVGTVGVEATRSDVTSDIFGDHAEHAFAAYAEGEQRAGRGRLTAGARADFRTLDGGAVSGVVSPRVGAVWPTPLGTWRASVGRGFRAPSLAERFVAARAFGYRVIPSPGLAPETAWSYELGDGATLGARGRLDAAVFWTEARQLIEPAFIFDSGVPAIQLQNVARARLRGLDASLVATPFADNLVTSVSYTYLDAQDRATGTVLAFRPAHVATLGADYAWHAFTVGGDFRYVSRIERIALAGSYAGDPRVAAKVLDLRAGWARDAWSARLLLTNALNYIYSLTPGTLEPVRTLSVVLGWTY